MGEEAEVSLFREWLAGIGTLFVILFFVGVYYGGDNVPNSWLTGVSYYEENDHHSCHVIVTEPSVIIRIDDVTDNKEATASMILEILRRNLSVTLGVIPERLSSTHPYNDLLVAAAQDSRVEVAVHGSNHSVEDINITENDLARAFDKTVAELGVVPVTYIPPFNAMTPQAYSIASEHFKVISMTGDSFKSGEVGRVDQTVETFDYEGLYSTHKGPSSVPIITEECQRALAKNNLCVVTFHPQELSTDIENATDVNATHYIHFLATLDALERLNATFINLKDTTRCTE